MPLTPEQIAERIAAFRALDDKVVVELVKWAWPMPDGDTFYSSTLAPELFAGFPISGANIELRLPARTFQEIMRDSTISDDVVQFDMWDGDGVLSDLAHAHGDGIKVEIYYWLPQVQLLLSQWWGHSQPPQDADCERFKASASFGFRSSMLDLPRRAFYTGCQALFDDEDCGYSSNPNRQNDPVTGQPYTACERNRPACIARQTDDLSYLAFDTVVESYLVHETKGPNITVTTRGNETNLKRPLRVIAGSRHVRDMDVLGTIVEPDTKHPDKGSMGVLAALSEGPDQSIRNFKIMGQTVGPQHLNVRNGELRQGRTAFSAHVANYSGTALCFGRVQGDFTKVSVDQIQCEADVQGKRDVRVYSDAETYIKQYTTDRAFWLLECFANKRWGLGYDYSRFVIDDWIALSQWGLESVKSTDENGNPVTIQRTDFNAELIDRSAQQQINDICLSGRFGLPFADNGFIRAVPLKKVADLSSVPFFTDVRGPDANICVDGNGKSTLTRTILPDSELPNRVIVTLDDEQHNNSERPLTFEDIDAQLRAGRAFGDTSRRAVEKPYALLGVTRVAEAIRLGNLLLHLGPFDEGGTENNLRITFTTWYECALTLKKYDVIKVASRQLDRYGFDYFRVRTIRRMPDLKVEISAQAYPVEYYNLLESDDTPPLVGTGALGNPAGNGSDRPTVVSLNAVTHTDDRVRFALTA